MLAVSRFRIADGLDEAARQAFEKRPHLATQAAGFQGMNVYRDLEDPATLLLVTKWSDEESCRAWHLREGGIPEGVRLDESGGAIVELREVNSEMAALIEEHARHAEKLKAAKAAVEMALRQLNSMYWHLRRGRAVLPICMKCGKVNAGDEHWEALLDFMQHHFPFLSHGYCPDCAAEVAREG